MEANLRIVDGILTDVPEDAGALYVGVRRRRTWRERLFSRPWRPWVSWETELKPLGVTAGGLTFTRSGT